jgi:flagellar biosynthetic protein FliO
MKEAFNIVIYLFFFVLVMIGAYYASRWISLKSFKLFKGKYMDIVERVSIDKDKSFILLKKGEKVYLVGVTNQNMTLLDNFESTELPEVKEAEKPTTKILSFGGGKTVDFKSDPLSKLSMVIGQCIAKAIKRVIKWLKDAKFKLPEEKMKTNVKAKTDEKSITYEITDEKDLNEIIDKMNMKKQQLNHQRQMLRRSGPQ